ncbi:hypothetical protein RFI_05281 [Reticulomyxa filosa]|uniref:Uncharacterized protein n=1 Tax=Reticulomyxa filosa TaxID=46433 RepID=X6NZU5_RETFI|nr:hypothetical protein RFI_05281 [Reticulomyxa filosa]|eukprot:ETO31835.1 hypothetical protein RFI_05281 [Reticulomyxa filosa]
MEYLRIPKHASYNHYITSMYQTFVPAYQMTALERSTTKKEKTSYEVIGSGDFATSYQAFDHFRSIGNDAGIIDDAILYFFRNPEKMHEGLPKDLLKQIEQDKVLFACALFVCLVLLFAIMTSQCNKIK